MSKLPKKVPFRTRPLVLLVTVAAVGCAHDRRAEKREERREELVEARKVERHQEVVEARREERGQAIADRTGWRKLGDRIVDSRRDKDVITVGGREGAFRRLMIVVENSAVEMHDVVVNFRDGSHFSPATRLVFGANTRSGVIDLPGAERVIRTVEFRYGNLPGGGRAEVELWGR
jgi:hypothetical protein